MASRAPAAVAVLCAAVAGVAVELLVSFASGRREAWDSPAYWMVGYPALILASAALGALWPSGAWKLGFVAPIAQILTMMLRTGAGSLWPLGLIFGAVLGVPCSIAANAGRRMRGRGAPDPEADSAGEP
jgi:hypothetical protein